MIFKDPSGKEYDVDPSTKEINWRISVYGVVINENGEALMLQPHFNAQWQFPGGKIEIDEVVDNALKRQFLEEVGYKISTAKKELLYFNEQNFYDAHADLYFHSFQLTFKVALEEEKQYEEFIERGEGMDYGDVSWVQIGSLTEKDVQYTHWPIVKMLR